jgi:polyvinyl alcohol dehydrogenase (cytochrome)
LSSTSANAGNRGSWPVTFVQHGPIFNAVAAVSTFPGPETVPCTRGMAAAPRTRSCRAYFPAGARYLAVAALAAIVLPVAGLAGAPATAAPRHDPGWSDWTSAGQNNHNTRDAAAETIIGPGNVGGLVPRWVLPATGNVAATPTVSGGVVYVPDLGGTLWAVNAATGNVIWSASVGAYLGVPFDVSRTSPAIDGNEIVIGTGATPVTALDPVGAYLLGINATTGALLWKKKVATDPYAMITGSPVIDDGVVYAGVSSDDELASPLTPTFRGSVVALSERTGRVLWQTYTAPPGYTGNAVWGSTPVVDHATGLLYVATGNNYSVPSGVCQSPVQTGCTPPAADDYFDSVLGLNLQTGAVAWARGTLTADAFTATSPQGPDYDFGSGPNLYTATINGQPMDLLGVGQKSGIYWALDPATGAVVWKTQVGPGGPEGGIEWGSATDGTRVYAAISDYLANTPYTITSASGQTSTITGGSWSALDAATGKILWQTADPQGAPDLGFVSTANGVVYAGSATLLGDTMYALDASDGTILWGYPSGGAVISGAAIVNGSVYWGSGYFEPAGVSNNALYAFSLPGSGSYRAGRAARK